jgi:hypothetical protein
MVIDLGIENDRTLARYPSIPEPRAAFCSAPALWRFSSAGQPVLFKHDAF